MNPLAIKKEYDIDHYLDYLGGYNLNRNTDELLDLWREILYSGNYYWQMVTFPYASQTLVAPNASVKGNLQLIEGSFITGISTFCDYSSQCNGSAGPAGFKLAIYDKGSKSDLYYGSYQHSYTAGSEGSLLSSANGPLPPDAGDLGVSADTPFNSPQQRFSPIILTRPAILNWEVVNLNNSNAQIQVALDIAVPVTALSIGIKQINKGGIVSAR